MATILIKLCIDNDRKDLVLMAAIAGIGFDVLVMTMMFRLFERG